jgi:hypothetical protein
LRLLALPAAVALVVFVCLRLWGSVDLTEDVYTRYMAAKLPHADRTHMFWSGYFEVSSSLANNLTYARTIPGKLLQYPGTWFLLAYVALVARLVRIQFHTAGPARHVWLLAAAPLLAALVAGDLYRWIVLAANLNLLLLLHSVCRVGERFSPRNYYPILAFTLLAPFGAADLDAPFPLHRFVFAKLFPA